jgi:hypothetical protein
MLLPAATSAMQGGEWRLWLCRALDQARQHKGACTWRLSPATYWVERDGWRIEGICLAELQFFLKQLQLKQLLDVKIILKNI